MSEKLTLDEEIGAKADRKIEARESTQSAFFGLGSMGVIGWTVSIPTLLGAAIGRWLDMRNPGHTTTLAFLVAGLCVGCFYAWIWICKQSQERNP